ncbi:mTERF family protein [Musa troglodytarum]|uniref:mTERF family protein n=1 Tax=Musa troglodytarum TaxID=320322 RepID=A0A9E7IAQ8_9LILI|nr:mTERF family protein [Musa troglodytarum]
MLVSRNALLPLLQLHRLRGLFSSSSADGASPDTRLMVEYLVKSCGFSATEAAEASKPLAHLRSTEKPDAVLTFMRSQGLDGAPQKDDILEAWIPLLRCGEEPRPNVSIFTQHGLLGLRSR